ncbi:U3 small nucleolar ribonucleoprotein IMP4 [Schistosoma japonicum]|nr:U3 small nucleolar ribonucleoprotein IMP4 [Schistosoma japonicum]
MLKAALAEGKTLPREIQEDALQLNEELDWSDDGGEGVVTSQDDEYLWAGTEDPRVVVTTSRSPSSKLKEFAKELRFLIPNATKINRGNYLNKNLLEACLAKQIMISTIILRFSLVLIHHTYKYVDKKLELTEHGPSFDLRLYKILRGPLHEEATADVEWVYRPYMNTTFKRRFLSEPTTP